MNLVYIHQYFETPNEFGGLRSYKNALHMIEHGHQVTVVSGASHYHSSDSVKRTSKWIVRETIDGIHVIWIDSIFSSHRSFFSRFLSFIVFMFLSAAVVLRLPADAVYATSPPLTVIVPAFIASFFKRCKLIFEIRDIWPESAVTTGVLKNRAVIFIAEWLEWFAYYQSDALVAVSAGIRDALVERGIDPVKCFVVPHGADLDLLHPQNSREQVRKRLGLPDGFVATYAGTFGWANGLETVLDAAERLRESTIHFLLIGDGKEKNNLLEKAKELKLSNVTFAAPVPKREIVDVLAASDAGLMILRDSPTFKTVLPNKLLDYMGCGLPIVINFSGFSAGLVEQAGGGAVVRPNDAGALSEALSGLSEQPEAARQLGEAGRQFVIDHYSRERCVSLFREVVEKVVVAQ